PGIDSAEKSHGRYSTEDTVVVFADDSVDRIKKKSLDNKEINKPKLQWVAIEDKYFAKIFTPSSKDIQIIGLHQSYKGEKKDLLLSDLVIVGKSFSGTVFIGPKDYEILKKLGHNYDKIVNFGFFGLFAKWLFFALRWINGWVHNYGWTIILLTIFIRLLIFPISQAGLRSMKDMQRVQPKMKEIQAKYKKYGKDLTKKQEMNREIKELYKKEGVSPLGGCLPMVLQIPIFFIFWSVLLNVIDLRQAPFIFWIKDLSTYDPYYVLPVLMGVSQLVSQMITPATGDETHKKMMYALPIVFTVLLATAPSGLIVYWTTNNIFQIVQQMLVNRSMKEAVGE
ncbi:MAG: membrane protein insertase YidC, partial [Acidobacteria bacterium]|nr:membrane protein insertase YidC [Acidobacteriota bacterium]